MADLHAVPDTDWAQLARSLHASVVTNANTDNEIAHSCEDGLKDLLVQAVLTGAPIDVLREVAQICASTVFIDYRRWYA